MILEGLVTSVDEDGAVRLSPMGPLVGGQFERLTIRPYGSSRTLANLQRTGQGVFHVTDDVELLAQAAVDRLVNMPELLPAEDVDGYIVATACRWYAFRVTGIEAMRPRAEIDCQVVACGRLRDFFGFNRAKHAVVEAAILATRLEWIPAQTVRQEMNRLAPLVAKTGGPGEHRAFSFLQQYVEEMSPDESV